MSYTPVRTEYVWIHVHEGTIISAYKFDSLDAAQAFSRKHSGTDEQNDLREPGMVAPLPNGITDDPNTDAWIFVTGQVTFVDGEPPFDRRDNPA